MWIYVSEVNVVYKLFAGGGGRLSIWIRWYCSVDVSQLFPLATPGLLNVLMYDVTMPTGMDVRHRHNNVKLPLPSLKLAREATNKLQITKTNTEPPIWNHSSGNGSFLSWKGHDALSHKKDTFLNTKLTPLKAMLLPAPLFTDLGNALLTYGFPHNIGSNQGTHFTAKEVQYWHHSLPRSISLDRTVE